MVNLYRMAYREQKFIDELLKEIEGLEKNNCVLREKLKEAYGANEIIKKSFAEHLENINQRNKQAVKCTNSIQMSKSII